MDFRLWDFGSTFTSCMTVKSEFKFPLWSKHENNPFHHIIRKIKGGHSKCQAHPGQSESDDSLDVLCK